MASLSRRRWRRRHHATIGMKGIENKAAIANNGRNTSTLKTGPTSLGFLCQPKIVMVSWRTLQ